MAINHIHILIRAECLGGHQINEKHILEADIERVIKDINMKVVIPARAVWVDVAGNDGFTVQAGLETSHFTEHQWTNPDEDNLAKMSSSATVLIQSDIYTCGCMGTDEVKTILDRFNQFGIVRMHIILIQRDTIPMKVISEHTYEGFATQFSNWVDNLVI